MDSIREQMALTSEISDAISNPVGMGTDLDEDELKNELDELEPVSYTHLTLPTICSV